MTRRLPGAAALAGLLLMSARALAATPHTVEELLRPPQITGAAMSPDGRHVAMLNHLDERTPDTLLMVDVEKLGKPGAVSKIPIGNDDTIDAEWVAWASDDRLLIGLSIGGNFERIPAGGHVLREGRAPNFRVVAIDPDGGHPVVLFSSVRSLARESFRLAHITSMHGGDPDTVLMPAWTGGTYDLFRVNVRSGAVALVDKGRPETTDWVAKDGHAVLRYDRSTLGDMLLIYGRESPTAEWTQWMKRRWVHDADDGWEFASEGPDPGKIYVRVSTPESDVSEIRVLDIATRTVGDCIAGVPGYDIQTTVTIDGVYAGAGYIDDRVMYALNDSKLQAHLDGVNRYFKNGASVELVNVDRTHTRMLLHVNGPRDPGDYYLYDAKRANLELLRSSRPWLDPARLPTMEVRRIKTRDGAEISAYLTRPIDSKGPLPLIVRPHGNHYRDYIHFDLWAEVLAAQGWLVVQPNFRGSTGHGRAFTALGDKQWSLRVQDDLTDTVNDLVRAGIADPHRIAIVGEGFGGYAALTAAMQNPDLYRAVVSVGGVTDLEEFLSYVELQEGVDNYRYWTRLIGDRKTDRALLKAASPALHADRIEAPVLLIHGGLNGFVPSQQSRLMKVALEHEGKQVKYLRVGDEANSAWSVKDLTMLYNQSIAFLRPILEEGK